MTRSLLRSVRLVLAAAVILTAAATLAPPTASAQAAACSADEPVAVVVDFGALGGGMPTACGAGATADKAFTSAGFTLAQRPGQAGFVCRVSGRPASGSCMGTDSYWGFFVSEDGRSWTYASLGVYQQKVAAGDHVALVWQSSADQRGPGEPVSAPTTKAPTAAPTPVAGSGRSTRTPRPKPTKSPTASASPSATATTTPSATASTRASARPTPTPTPSASVDTSAGASASPSPTPTGDPTPDASTDATQPTADESGGLPGWVPPVVVVLLVVAAGGVAWARRSQRQR